MPNNCENTLKITGPRDDVQAFRDLARNRKDKTLDINKLVPMPDEIRNTKSPNQDVQLAARLQKEYGAEDWYDWACRNWGTKWMPYDGHMEEEIMEETGQASICYWFFTAWDPLNKNFMMTISAKFPTLNMRLEYSEPGMRICGYYKLKSGHILEFQQTEMDDEDEGQNEE